jgi:hypothetical protein
VSGQYPDIYHGLEKAEEVLRRARQTYGGDIGVAYAGHNSSSKAIKAMESRLEDDSLRLAMSMMDC